MSHVKLIYDAEKGVMVPLDGGTNEARARAPRICYVDDSRTSSYVTLKILRQYGYEVDAFHTAEEALEALMEQDYDLLLTDLILSHGEGMNGDDLVRVLRQCGMPDKARLPTVVITGDQSGALAEKLHQAGADEVLVKPIKGKDLNRVLQRLLAGKESAPVLEQAVSRGKPSSPQTPPSEPVSPPPESADVVTQVIDGFDDFSERPSIFSELEDPLRARRPARPSHSAAKPNPFLPQDEPPPPPPPPPKTDEAAPATPARSGRTPAAGTANRAVAPPPEEGPQSDGGGHTPGHPHTAEGAAVPRRPAAPVGSDETTPENRQREAPSPPDPLPPQDAPDPPGEDSLLSLLEDFDSLPAQEKAAAAGKPRRALGVPLLLLLVALVVSAVGWGAWSWWSGREPAVTLVEVSRGPIYQAVHAAGRVVSDRFVEVTSHGPGQLVAVLVKEGDRVKKGQLLARMDDQDARMRVKRIEATLISLQEEVSRANKIRERLSSAFRVGAVSRQALDDAIADWTAASARQAVAEEELAAARLALERTRIKAPFAGIVTEVRAHAGQWISPPQPILKLVDDERKLVRLRVDAADSARLAPGQTVILSSEAFPDRRWREKVLRIAPSTEANVVEVEVSLGRNAPDLRLGQPVTGEIRIQGSENALKLPLEALVEHQGRAAVMVIRDGRIHFVPVETGIEDFTHVEIRSGLAAGDHVVLPGGRTFQEGQTVQVAGVRG